MKRTINFNDFVDEFNRFEDRKDQFSYHGKRALFEHVENYEEDTGKQIELDIVALCCEFTEFANLEEFQEVYHSNYLRKGEEYDTIEAIEERTIVIPILDNAGNKTERFLIQDF